MPTEYDKVCTVTCTDNDKVAEAEVERFEEKQFLDIWLATNKIHMEYNGRVYVGNKMGFEFTTPGPRVYQINRGRGFQMAVTVKYKKEDWQAVADCIRSDQVPAADVVAIFEDNPEFAEWYKKEYLK